MDNIVLKADALTKTYRSGVESLTVLDNVSFAVTAGEAVSIVGPSGSGKTTLLGLCAGLDLPSSGEVHLLGNRLSTMTEDDRALMRNKSVGFVFQNFQLLPTLTALENVILPAELRGDKKPLEEGRALLERVGLKDRMTHYPSQLSGGEQQRVAVARAFMTRPAVLFADEPTGNLDEENAVHIADLVFGMNRERGTTLVLVTHNPELAGRTDRILEMKGGRVIKETHIKRA